MYLIETTLVQANIDGNNLFYVDKEDAKQLRQQQISTSEDDD